MGGVTGSDVGLSGYIAPRSNDLTGKRRIVTKLISLNRPGVQKWLASGPVSGLE